MEIRRTALGENHPDYAQSLDDLAALYREMGDHAAALALCRQAVEVNRTAPGEDHPHFARNLNELATLYQAMGDYETALPFFAGRWRSTAPR